MCNSDNESFPPDRPSKTLSPSRIMLKSESARPVLWSKVFSGLMKFDIEQKDTDYKNESKSELEDGLMYKSVRIDYLRYTQVCK